MTTPITDAAGLPAAVDLYGDYAEVTPATVLETGEQTILVTFFDEGDTESGVGLAFSPAEATKLAGAIKAAVEDLAGNALTAYRDAAKLTAAALGDHRAHGDTDEVLAAYRRAAAATLAAADLDAAEAAW